MNASGQHDERRGLWWPSPAVEHARTVLLDVGAGFDTAHGATLPEIQVSYESWGELNAAKDNTALVIHPLASDCHASGAFAGQAQGWWEPLIGPGRVIDTDRYFVVCPNLLGGCYGSTGPRFPAPDGDPWLDRFPLLTPRDLMRAQRLFLRRLGIDRARLVVGPSMGGMVAWEWAIEGGDAVDRVAVVAAPLRTTAYQIGLNWLQRRGIELDLGGDEAAARWGQMIARGVGMISYRSGLGLEEKFGRSWFKKPGNSLRERGRFNVESWLRHHGKRIVKRFDPYTYLLFSRVMDLHDVGEGRGGLAAALDRIRCEVTVAGISSDELYPADDVRLGAVILDHLGREAAYREIRSPHGHDAFLLETDQLASILAEAPRTARGPLPIGREGAVRTARLGILGAGAVADRLVALLRERRREIRDDLDLRFEIGAVTPADAGSTEPARLVERGDLDAIVDLTPGGGEPELIRSALVRRRPVVTPNKTLIRRHGAELERVALEHGTRLAYHNSIAAGWPLLYSIESVLARGEADEMQALLSSSCNRILDDVETGSTVDDAVARAEARGLLEADPELDLSGWDAAQKLTILIARAAGVRYRADELHTAGIAGLDTMLVREAPTAGYRVRLVAIWVAGDAPVAGVLPAAVAADGHLGGVRGDTNVIVLHGGPQGERVFLGEGSGELPIATALLGDLIGLFRPGRSWTGRYPAATAPPGAPRFSRHLVHDGSRTRVGDDPAAASVPLLDSLVHPRG